MKKIIKISIYTLIVFVLFISSNQNIFAENVNSVTHMSKPTAEWVKSNKYFKVSVEISPSGNFDLYLLLDKKKKDGEQITTHTLCHIDSSTGNTQKITFDPNPKTGNCQNQLVIDRNFFTSKYEYFAYVSDKADGLNIAIANSYGSGRIMFDDIPSTIENDVINISNIELISKNSQNYYKIKGNINEDGTGDLNFFLLKTGEAYWIPIKSITHKKANFEFPLTNNEIDSTPKLMPGTYTLKIENSSGDTILTQAITDEIIDSAGAVASHTSKPPIYNGTALVDPGCGYSASGDGKFRMCGFTDAMSMLNRIINFIFALVLPIAAIVFVYVGFLYISSAANPEKRTVAKKAMGKLILGIVVIMLAWIIIKTVLSSLGVGEGFSFLGLRN